MTSPHSPSPSRPDSAGHVDSSGAPRPQIDALTGLRFFAAFHVVLYHNSGYLERAWSTMPEGISNLIHVGYSGVNLFFVLWGFILAYTYATPTGELKCSRRRFWIARIARIYPLYLFSLALAAPAVIHHFFSSNSLSNGLIKLFVSAISALTLVQSWLPPLRSIWNAPSWSLSAEAWFYLAFPFIIAPVWRLSRRNAWALGVVCWLFTFVPWLIAGMALPADISSAVATEPIGSNSLGVFLRSSPLFRVHEFVLGIVVARLVLAGATSCETRSPEKPAPWVGPILLAALIALPYASAKVPRLWMHGGVFDPIYVLAIVYLIGSRGRVTAWLGRRWWVRLGEASYGVYILHIPIRSLMLSAWDEKAQNTMGLEFFLPYAIVVVIGSLAAFRVVEEPARRRIKAWSTRA